VEQPLDPMGEEHRLHLESLEAVISAIDDELDERRDEDNPEFGGFINARAAFANMRDHIPAATNGSYGCLLSPKQIRWVQAIADLLGVRVQFVPAKPVPRGREVGLIVGGWPKPLKPPGR
jgi:hypothetical protein